MPNYSVKHGKKNMSAIDLIVNVTDGTLPANSKCEFCVTQTTKHLMIVDSNKIRFDGMKARAFPLCSHHLKAIDKLLTSKKDIDSILNVIETVLATDSFNIR